MSASQFARRPVGVTALACVFAFGVLASGFALVTLASPGGALDSIWKINPRGHDAFLRLGAAAFPLLGTVCLACAGTAFGLAKGKKWGYRAAVVMLGVNLAGDLVNVLTGYEPRAIIGVPIVATLLWYLSRPAVRHYFFHPPGATTGDPKLPR